jgi:hypothetical protein
VIEVKSIEVKPEVEQLLLSILLKPAELIQPLIFCSRQHAKIADLYGAQGFTLRAVLR